MTRPSEPPSEPTSPPRSRLRKPRKRAPDPKRLRTRLLAQIERQIERFDAALDAETPPSGFDSGKVLRDLGGLKNLLDDVRAADRAAREDQADGARGPLPASVADLVAMRAEIARRYAAFAAAEPDDGVLGPPFPGAAPPA